MTRAAVALFAVGAAACSAVLGLDPPRLDPCATANGCTDATTADTGPSGDAALAQDAAGDDGSTDATPDRGPITGVRCGGGASAFGCVGPTPVCCLSTDDAGASSYACESSVAACGGYPISCATYNDCSGSSVCCFYHSAIKCEPSCTTNSTVVCDPSGPADQCPTGSKCSVVIQNGATTLPYFGCTP